MLENGTSLFNIDLTKIDGEGEFPCPSCGEIISPEDYSRIAYDIMNIKMKHDNSLDEILVICKKCQSIIRLNGFEMLNEIENLDDALSLDDYLKQ